MSKAVPFQTIQFSIGIEFSSILLIEMTLLGATPSGQTGPGSKGNEGVLRISQSFRITGASIRLFSIISRKIVEDA